MHLNILMVRSKGSVAGVGDIETVIQEIEGREEQTAVVGGAEAGSATGPATQNNPATESTPWSVAISGHVTDNVACSILYIIFLVHGRDGRDNNGHIPPMTWRGKFLLS